MSKDLWESKVSGWQADRRPATEQLRRHADELAALVGTRLTGAWSIWTGKGIDDWFADMPIVLQFDGARQLEVCWQKFDDLSISWNTINLEQPPRAWVEGIAWYPWRLTAFSANKGETVTEVAGTTFPVDDHGRRLSPSEALHDTLDGRLVDRNDGTGLAHLQCT